MELPPIPDTAIEAASRIYVMLFEVPDAPALLGYVCEIHAEHEKAAQRGDAPVAQLWLDGIELMDELHGAL